MPVHWNVTDLPSGKWGLTANEELVLDETNQPVVFDISEDAHCVADDMNTD